MKEPYSTVGNGIEEVYVCIDITWIWSRLDWEAEARTGHRLECRTGPCHRRNAGSEGASVVVHGRDAERTEAVRRASARPVERRRPSSGDLTTDAGADAVADAAGDVDILVNNAGGYDGLPWSRAHHRPCGRRSMQPMWSPGCG